jgi:hypothetical protein
MNKELENEIKAVFEANDVEVVFATEDGVCFFNEATARAEAARKKLSEPIRVKRDDFLIADNSKKAAEEEAKKKAAEEKAAKGSQKKGK